MVKKVLLLSNTATLGTNYGYKVVQYMLKIIKPVSTQIHKKMKKSQFLPAKHSDAKHSGQDMPLSWTIPSIHQR